MLFAVSVAVELGALLAAIWLGLYLVTRNAHRPVAWLAALTAWSMGGLFLNMLFALDPPPIPVEPAIWQALFLIWPKGILQQEPAAWLQGWTATLSPVLWFHATHLMYTPRLQTRHWLMVAGGYLLAAGGILIQALRPETYNDISGDPLFLNTLQGSLVYGAFLSVLVIYCGLSIRNLILTARMQPHHLPRSQMLWLCSATVLAGATGPVGMAVAFLGIPAPMALIALLIAGSVLMTSYGVARYSALMENRIFFQDFMYSALLCGAATVVWLGLTSMLAQTHPFPITLYVVVGCLAVITFSLLDMARQRIDFLSAQQDKRLLREKLRSLGNNNNAEALKRSLETICLSLDARYAVLLAQDNGSYKQAASYHWPAEDLSLPVELISADDLKPLQAKELPGPLANATWLFPIYMGEQQVGALLLGPAEHGMAYAPVELENMLDFNDYLASQLTHLVLHRSILKETPESQFVTEIQRWPYRTDQLSSHSVETGLRHLHDYNKLSETPLAELRLVRRRAGTSSSHFSAGQAVHSLLSESLEHLRPMDGSEHLRIHGVPRRDWYPYIILRDAYLNCLPNREIMDRLYISEGTFNRTRRSAIQRLTCLLAEMESRLPE